MMPFRSFTAFFILVLCCASLLSAGSAEDANAVTPVASTLAPAQVQTPLRTTSHAATSAPPRHIPSATSVPVVPSATRVATASAAPPRVPSSSEPSPRFPTSTAAATVRPRPTTSPRRVPNAHVYNGNYEATLFAENINGPREVRSLPNGDLLLVVLDDSNILRLWDDNGDLYSDAKERMVVAAAPGLNHALFVDGTRVYASSTSTVYRWTGLSDQRTRLQGPIEVVVNIPPNGSHKTRTIAIFGSYMYVTVGSEKNIAKTSWRSQIRRFSLSGAKFPLEWTTGEVFADGLRNVVGLGFDRWGGLWGVEHGCDNIADWRDDPLAVTDDNPVEKLNFFNVSKPPSAKAPFYGYPYCFSTGKYAGKPLATQLGTTRSYDAFCAIKGNVVTPALAFQAHSAPINIQFYPYWASQRRFGFPSGCIGDAYVSFRGSWDRSISTGYRVVRVQFSGGWPRTYEPFFWWNGSTNSTATAHSGSKWRHRPTGLTVGQNGELFVAEQVTNVIVAIRYRK